MIILAALFFGLIALGFTLLTVMPFILLFLWLGVYLEPRARPAAAQAAAPEVSNVIVPAAISASGWVHARSASTISA